ncbi:polyprenyl synthetase family protein [Nitrosophilus alvini]|uniref:polyprenyl synthetase family protein n=1 Tax=Nitrosophilus alvini TaxID=2714855 RepID=UPI0019091B8E|nr:polyprenyl synthetase family protein [Nitrosophilus alvini]
MNLEAVETELVSLVKDLDDETSVKLFEKLPKGKRLRSKLILKIAPQSKEAVKLSAIIELIHAASLLHDDVIDDALTRRGAPSLNALFGNKTSIMLGDILYSKAFYELVSMGEEIAKRVSNAVTLLSIGEMMDVELSKRFNPDFDLYFDMIYKKTASLIEASAASAAVIANKNPENYGLYGKNLGIAFQIVDDILDIVSDEKTLGKPALNDYKEGKTTLPYIYLYNDMTEEEKQKLVSYHGKELNVDESKWIKEMFEKYDSVQKSHNFAKKLGLEALKSIESDDRGGDLTAIMKNLIERSY